MYRFFREIQTRIEKVHPNLLFVHGWLIPEPDVLYVLMEKAELDVTTALQQGFLALKTRLEIAVDVANGLKAIHSANYVHQDLKADSILVRYDAHITSLHIYSMAVFKQFDRAERAAKPRALGER